MGPPDPPEPEAVEEDIDKVVAALARSQAPRIGVYLGGKGLLDAGVFRLFEGFCRDAQLKERLGSLVSLNLDDNGLSADALCVLGQEGMRLPALTHLSLNDNRIGEGETGEGLSAFVMFVKQHACLEELHVARNGFHALSSCAFAEAISDNTTLRSLDFSGNTLGLRGGWAFADTVGRAHRLVELRFNPGFQGSNFASQIRKHLVAHTLKHGLFATATDSECELITADTIIASPKATPKFARPEPMRLPSLSPLSSPASNRGLSPAKRRRRRALTMRGVTPRGSESPLSSNGGRGFGMHGRSVDSIHSMEGEDVATSLPQLVRRVSDRSEMLKRIMSGGISGSATVEDIKNLADIVEEDRENMEGAHDELNEMTHRNLVLQKEVQRLQSSLANAHTEIEKVTGVQTRALAAYEGELADLREEAAGACEGRAEAEATCVEETTQALAREQNAVTSLQHTQESASTLQDRVAKLSKDLQLSETARGEQDTLFGALKTESGAAAKKEKTKGEAALLLYKRGREGEFSAALTDLEKRVTRLGALREQQRRAQQEYYEAKLDVVREREKKQTEFEHLERLRVLQKREVAETEERRVREEAALAERRARETAEEEEARMHGHLHQMETESETHLRNMRETFKKEVETQRTEFAARKRKEEEHIEHVLTQLRRQSTEDDERLRQEKLELDKKLSLSLNATEERMLALRMAHARRKLEVEQQGEMELESLRLEQERHIKDLSLKAYQHTLQLQHQQQEAVEEIERTRESNDRKFKEQSRLLKKTRDAVQKAVQNADQLQTVTQSQMELMLGKQKESEDRRRLLQKEREHALGEMADILARVKSAIVEEPTLNTDLGFKPFSQILFEKHDKAGNGEIDRTEFRNLCYEAGHFLTPEELPSAFEAADADGDGVVCYENFVNWWRSYHKFGNLNLSDADTKRRQRSVEVFHRFDEDHDGSIDIREFPAFFAGLQVAGLVPEDMSRATCLQELDEDSNGVVELNEYVQWLWSYKLL